MKRSITIKGNEVEYTVKRHPRARTINLTVHANGAVGVTIPRWGTLASAERFVRSKTDWLSRVLHEFKKSGDIVIFPRNDRRQYKKHKETARRLVHKRLEYFNQFYDFSYKRVFIRAQKTRWGSCSESGNLNFNYKLVHLPEHLADYVIVHELCHLGELNHSKRFWQLVAKTVPDHKRIEKELSKYRTA